MKLLARISFEIPIQPRTGAKPLANASFELFLSAEAFSAAPFDPSAPPWSKQPKRDFTD
jgi:hypothetical protein